jgi:hypothetical protein
MHINGMTAAPNTHEGKNLKDWIIVLLRLETFIFS